MTKVLKARFVHVDGRAAEINYYDKDSSASDKAGNNSNIQEVKRPLNMVSEEALNAKVMEAEMLLSDARAQAEEILSNAREQAKTLMEQARTRVMKKGKKAGLTARIWKWANQ